MSNGIEQKGQEYIPEWDAVLGYERQMQDKKTAEDVSVGLPETEVQPNDRESAVVRTFEKLPTGNVRQGQEYDRDQNRVRPFTEQLRTYADAAPEVGVAATEIRPIGRGASVVRKYIADPTFYENWHIVRPGKANVQIPDILESVEVVWANATGVGDYESEWNGVSSGSSPNWSLSGSENGNAQGSASVVPELIITTRQIWARNISSRTVFFYMPEGVITTAQILAKLTALLGATVLDWPVFKPATHTFIVRGMKVSVQATVNAQASVSNSTGNYSESVTKGSGTSEDVAHSISTIQVGPVVHGAITVTGGTTDTANAVAAADVGWLGTNFPTVNVAAAAFKAAAGSVTPTSLPATTPAAVPVTGLYMIDVGSFQAREGQVPMYAEILDATLLA